MKKYQKNFIIKENRQVTPDSVLMKLAPADGDMPEMEPGQFVNILVPQAPGAFLRRPISICNVKDGLLWLFIKNVGKGSKWLCSLTQGYILDIVLPLGHGWTMPSSENGNVLLIGGGVGVAPLLYWGEYLKSKGYKPSFLLGAATESSLTLIDEFSKIGAVHLTTDDGSHGVKGTVLAHPIVAETATTPDKIYCCGPTPMMKGVAALARERGIDCEVSLENHMACGIGACLCCVENTKEGHICVCTVGPVFNIDNLNW
ncbi:MAG: dihydroorotate dehydrogenase electron transfer subunit [Prevotella sp.]|nr:dihydroorotate dehydrogenase electron transfer subunit [Prevotella sp.]MCM1075533.1 dihydroorotate dehydrogenase electron transfer subunit [Ruminococcus sp.]